MTVRIWHIGDTENRIYPSTEALARFQEFLDAWDKRSDLDVAWDCVPIKIVEHEVSQPPEAFDVDAAFDEGLISYRVVSAERITVYNYIDAERDRQDARWGGPEHDDRRGPGDWWSLVARQFSDAGTHDHRTRLVKVAALAVAALESYDRLNGADECST